MINVEFSCLNFGCDFGATEYVPFIKGTSRIKNGISNPQKTGFEFFGWNTDPAGSGKTFNKDFVIMPAYAAKGLEFDSVIIIDNFREDKYLFYVAVTRAQHELIVLKK